MSDQLGNTVDGEIHVPVKDFHTLYYATKDGSQKPADHEWTIPQRYVMGIDVAPKGTDIKHEYGIAYANGKLDDVLYDSEGEARLELMVIRNQLNRYGIPEDHWPILMQREVITTTGSWKHLSV